MTLIEIHGLSPSGVNYGGKGDQEANRCLVFPLNSKNEIEEIYDAFLDEIVGNTNSSDSYRLWAFYDILPLDEKAGNEPNYQSALIAGTICAHTTAFLYLSDPEIIPLRNEHLGQFVDYLLKNKIAVAERLPYKRTEEEEALYGRLLADGC